MVSGMLWSYCGKHTVISFNVANIVSYIKYYLSLKCFLMDVHYPGILLIISVLILFATEYSDLTII